MAILTKDDLAVSVAKQTGLSTGQAKLAIEAVVEQITQRMAAGDEIKLTGFGKFSVAQRAPRTGRNPATGLPLEIPAKRVPKFAAGAVLKKAVQ